MKMSEPSARILLDSISPKGDRLTTLEVVMHRFVLAEFNTHRVFSRNSASSRAIPVRKQLERVKNDPALPISWPAEQKGMQGGEELTGMDRYAAEALWLEARDNAVVSAEILLDGGLHKSVVNRLLEPFMWHTVIVSSTNWDGFWAQRCSLLAQPEIHAAADAMHTAYLKSNPTEIGWGEWHMPLIQPEDHLYDIAEYDLRHISAARCARVSYLTHDGLRSLSADQDLYKRLTEIEPPDPPHASPLEHVATPSVMFWQQGNFDGWRQLRHEVFA